MKDIGEMSSDEIYKLMTACGEGTREEWESDKRVETYEDVWRKKNPRVTELALKKAAKNLGLSLNSSLSATDIIRILSESSRIIEVAYQNHLQTEYNRVIMEEARI